MLLSTEAFVLKSQKYREADSLLTLYSRQYGKMSAIAKGSRKPKSKMLAGVQPFTHAEFLLYKGKNMYTVSQVEVRHSFYPLREDYYRLAFAAYSVELVMLEALEGQGNSDAFSNFGNTLTLMCREETKIDSLIRAFELKMLTSYGYQPNFISCSLCGSRLSDSMPFFSNSQGGLVCASKDHGAKDVKPVSRQIVKLAQFYLQHDLKAAARLTVPEDINKELQQLIEGYIRYHFDYFAPKSLRHLPD